jgi:hypothetical protein
MSSARAIAAALGGQVAGRDTVACPGPGHSSRDRSLSVRLDPQASDGFVVHSHAGDDWQTCRDHVRAKLGLPCWQPGGNNWHRIPCGGKSHEPREAVVTSDDERARHDMARWLWSQRRPIASTPAEVYLREIRGITCALPRTLAYLPPTAKYPPTLIACFGLAPETEPGVLEPPANVDAVLRTYLRSDGRGKAVIDDPRKFLGSPGALPLVLAPPNDLNGLAITEGIEDGLSVYEATGLGVWVAGGAGRMPALAEMVPDYIETITIFADGDKAGQEGAGKLAAALDARGIAEVRITEMHEVA